MRVARIVAVACLFATALPACSGDQLSKADLISQADEICSRANDEATALGEPTSGKQFAELIDEAKAIQDEAIADLRQLKPPDEDQEAYASMIDSLEEANSYLPQFEDAVESDDQDAMQEIGQKIGTAAGQAQEIAAEYGFEVCAASRISGEG
jgi:hypothetical protein